MFFFFQVYGDHRDLHALTISFPTRRASDRAVILPSSSTFATALPRASASPSPTTWVRLFTSASADTRLGVLRALARLMTPAMARSPSPLRRSEEHTSELQSLMRISYAVFCLKKKN